MVLPIRPSIVNLQGVGHTVLRLLEGHNHFINQALSTEDIKGFNENDTLSSPPSLVNEEMISESPHSIDPALQRSLVRKCYLK
jgi:hypothetical protein